MKNEQKNQKQKSMKTEKQSLEVGYDIRFPKPKKERKQITKEEFYKKLEAS